MRRDFTINAIAFSKSEGYVDPYGGIDDLKSGIIRAVGDAHARFDEDALRILRGLRFASVLGFSLEEETKNAIKTCFPLLSFISKERIFDEIKKILCGKNAETVLSEFCEVFDFVFESDFSQKGLDSLPPDFALRFAFIFRQNPNGAQNALISLKADNKTKSEVKAILKNLANLCCAERTDLKRLLSDCGFETLQKSILISGNLSLLPVLKDIEKRGDCVRISDLAINGGDLLSLNIEPKNISGVLSEILNLVIDGKLENSKEDILGYLKKTL
jgi:tRNA nucleotidyltransferase (CCA-adding enzyme)